MESPVLGTHTVFVIEVVPRGRSPLDNGILRIGYCVGRLRTSEILISGHINVKPSLHQVLDEQFADTFLRMERADHRSLDQDAHSELEAIKLLMELMHTWENETTVTLVMDRVAESIPYLCTPLLKLGLPQIHFTKSGVYRPVLDLETFLRTFTPKTPTTSTWVDRKTVCDALGLYDISAVPWDAEALAKHYYRIYQRSADMAGKPNLLQYTH